MEKPALAIEESPLTVKDLSGFGEPVGKLIDALRAAGGVLFEPTAIRRRARAEADAEGIRSHGRAKAKKIAATARRRLQLEAVRQQENIERIAAGALRALPEQVPDTPVDPDWVTHFIGESKDTSNEEIQGLWSRILAGELASPGAYSRRTVSLVKLLEPHEAKLFSAVCQIAIFATILNPLIVARDPFVVSVGLTFDNLSHLDAIGLITFEPLAGYVWEMPTDTVKEGVRFGFDYCGTEFTIDATKATPSSDGKSHISRGQVMLTKQGKELARVVERVFHEPTLEYIIESLRKFRPASRWPRK